MNLIEQLGGYEKAKSIRDINIKEFEGDASGVTIHYMGNSITQEDLEDSLLEYRRQHNIYEESDKIVFIDDFMHDELMTVASTRKGEVWMDEGAKRCTDLSMIRHATDAEIKAGKRRPELDSDTCSDIRNHVSPLTKVIDR